MRINTYKELIVWQKSMDLVVEIYKVTKELPKIEEFALSSQMRRATVSIPSNIAEGYRRNNLKEYIQFLHIAIGSASELETQLIIINKIYPKINTEKCDSLLNEVIRMLQSIIQKLKIKLHPKP